MEGNILTLERVFDAPPQKLWDAFTKQDSFTKWWGPKGWNTEVKAFDFIEGGVNHYDMKCEDEAQKEWYGKYSWGKMVFSNIHPVESFSFTDYFCDENGVAQEGMPVSTTELRFVEENGKTKMISISTFESEEALQTVMRMGMLQGITETWDRLDETVSKESE